MKCWERNAPSTSVFFSLHLHAETRRILEEHLMSKTASQQYTGLDDHILEALAREVHAGWIGTKTAQGWQHGYTLDSDTKRHPSLVPYDSLPEHEKEVDRVTVRSVVTAFSALGYKITKVTPDECDCPHSPKPIDEDHP